VGPDLTLLEYGFTSQDDALNAALHIHALKRRPTALGVQCGIVYGVASIKVDVHPGFGLPGKPEDASRAIVHEFDQALHRQAFLGSRREEHGE
jgi:hypothetical protein